MTLVFYVNKHCDTIESIIVSMSNEGRAKSPVCMTHDEDLETDSSKMGKLYNREQPHFYQLRPKHGKNEAYLHECCKKGT